jgi:CDP-diacylglycerol--glycerol-3-phosphate 3-phosphatidyltransferase
VLVVTGFTGLGLPHVVLLVTLILLALASLITIVQRVVSVRRQALAEPSPAD